MTWKDLGANLDSHIGGIAERASRRLNRRTALRAGVAGGVASLAALAVGENPAAAYTYSPGCGPTPHCSGCATDGCPGGYELCLEKGPCGTPPVGGGHRNSHGYWCEWPGGIWESAHNLGHGNGYTLCYDCVRTPGNSGDCNSWCVCSSACFCCNCTTMADVRAEQKRTGLYYSASTKRGVNL
jgi:hypothetical protein